MSNTWITVRQAIEEHVVSGPGRRKRRRRRLHTLESPLLVVAQIHRQRELRDDETPNGLAPEQSMPVAWHYKMGIWLAPFLQAPNRRIAYFVQQALQYDPIRHFWAKRLARYFILNMTMRPGEEGDTLTRHVAALLNELSLPHSERRPQEAKDKFEKALNKLKEDGLISAWSYAESEADLPKREWFWIWLEWHVQVWGMPVQALAAASETINADKDAPPTA